MRVEESYPHLLLRGFRREREAHEHGARNIRIATLETRDMVYILTMCKDCGKILKERRMCI